MRYDTPIIRKAVLLALEEALDLTIPPSVLNSSEPNLEYDFHNPRPELEVTIRIAPVGELAADLPIDSSIRNIKDCITQAGVPRRDLTHTHSSLRPRTAVHDSRSSKCAAPTHSPRPNTIPRNP
ncbi:MULTISPECIES: hypothetical protein [unclassified Saccharopolyspora]|uniref:hypothetical protein n=1 Tax=unclassified Saccharopolyspora TaxID=2646250 RepID=UPI001CD266D0|nr:MULTISPECIES: hypothetical protein [unclassified Saccharopolyspora]MCA1188779.1 hypothetical protein [Saccharopolyspora sp. 6T]MCA1283271.1 hypothetical protein [Saccharopolyspora sp. 7B]